MNKFSRVALLSVFVVARMFGMEATNSSEVTTETIVSTDVNQVLTDVNQTATDAVVVVDTAIASSLTDASTVLANAAKEIAPVTPPTPADKTMFGKIAALPATTLAAILGTPKFISSYTFTAALNQIAKLGFLKDGRFAKNTDTIGQVMTIATMAALVYAAYTYYNAEEAVEANEDFFAEDAN